MKITKEIVQKTAHLARLQFNEAEEQSMIHDLQKMVDWMDKLHEINTDDMEPLTGMSYEKNQFRRDEVNEQLAKSEVFKNAPSHDPDYFKVPKVIKQK